MSTIHLATGQLDLRLGSLQTHDGSEQVLSAQERDLLRYLVERPNQDVPRDVLLTEVMGYAPGVSSRAIDHAIKRLRSKVEQVPARPFHLVGVRGVGYRFVPLATQGRVDASGSRIRLAEREVDLDRLTVRGPDAVEVALSSIEGRLLEVLLSHQDRPVSTLDLLREVWGVRDPGQRRVVDKAVYRLRGKLEPDPTEPRFLRTVRGRGLILECERVRVDAPAREPPRPKLAGRPVPARRDDVIGREDEVAAVRELLSADGSLVTLHGPAGVGKTTLAQAVLTDWSDAARLADLSLCQDVADVREALAGALGVDHHREGSSEALRAALADGEDRIVLVEHAEVCLEAAAEVLAAVRSGRSRLRLLVTSRHDLRLPGERVVRVRPLAPADAKALLVARARASGVEIDAEDPRVDVLIEEVDRLPLALELAAARLRLLGLEGTLHRMDNPLSLLTRGSSTRALDPRLASLRGSLSQTLGVLDAADRLLLAATTLFRGSFTLEAAEHVLQPLLEDDVVDGLQRLLDFALLRRGEQGRLEPFHGVAELVVEDQIEALAGLRAEAVPWLLSWYASLTSSSPAFIEVQPAEYARLEPELDGAIGAVELHGHRDPDRAAAVLAWVLPVLLRLGRRERTRALLPLVERRMDAQRDLRVVWAQISTSLRPERQHLDRILAMADQARTDGDAPLEAFLLGIWLYHGTDRGVADGVSESIERARALLPTLAADPAAESVARSGIGWVAFRSGDLDLAWRELQEALGLARYVDARWLQCRAARDLAGIAHAEGRLFEADAFLEIARDSAREVADIWSAYDLEDMRGLVWLEQGRLDEAEALHRDLLARGRETGDRVRAASQANRLGTIEGHRGSPAGAAAWFEFARAAHAALGNRSGEAACLYNLGECARHQGRIDSARELYDRALGIYVELGRAVHQGIVLGSIGRLSLAAGELEEAERTLRRALEHLERGRARRPAAEVRARLGYAIGQRDGAEGWATVSRAVDELSAIGRSNAGVEALLLKGRLALELGRGDAAREAVARARALVDALHIGAGAGVVVELAALAERLEG